MASTLVETSDHRIQHPGRPLKPPNKRQPAPNNPKKMDSNNSSAEARGRNHHLAREGPTRKRRAIDGRNNKSCNRRSQRHFGARFAIIHECAARSACEQAGPLLAAHTPSDVGRHKEKHRR
eukprot:Amastigsp_a842007_7.p1 type:complete len:121 gc:universal Amastigsp_a842007_7:293-655(+)